MTTKPNRPSAPHRLPLTGSRALAVLIALAILPAAAAQSLDDRLDEEQYLEGLRELDLPEVLDHYLGHQAGKPSSADEPPVIAQHRAIARDAARSLAEREAAIERMLAERASIIDENPRDPRLSGWLADQASDLYFELLALEASGWTAILGFPSASQRDRAARAGREIHELALRAEAAVEQAIFDLERTPGFAENLSLQRERRRLVEQERDRRIPFLLGVGASTLAHSEAGEEPDRADLFAEALEMLVYVAPRLAAPLAAQALVHAGFAALGLERSDVAEELFERALRSSETEINAVVRFAARLGLAVLDPAQAERDLQRLAAYPEHSRTIFYRLLIADRRFTLRRDDSLRDAAASYAELLEVDFDVDREAARDIILAKVADAVRGRGEAEELPPLAVVAMAERGLRKGEAGPTACADVESLLARQDLSELERAHAVLTLARLHHEAGELPAAARRYIQLARDHAGLRESPRAIEIGLALAAEQYRAAPEASRDVLREGLDVALASYPRLPSIDHWRFVAGRLALNESRYDDAMDRLASISRAHDLWIDGRVLRIEALHRAAGSPDNAQRRGRLFSELVEAALAIEPELRRALERAEGERAGTLRRHRLSVRIGRAAASTGLGEPGRAIELLADVETDRDADGRLIAEALQTRIEAYQALGRVADAQREISRFIEHAPPERVPGVLGPMLATLERRVNDLSARGLDEQARQVSREELAPLGVQLDAWMSAHPQRFDPTLALRLADAHRLAGEHRSAIRLYDRLLAAHPNASHLIYGKAECLYHLGLSANDESSLGEAMTLYRRLASAGRGAQPDDRYWQSHLRTLQILDATGRNTHQIVPQIQRLRLRDPNLGGERLRVEFERLQNKYAG